MNLNLLKFFNIEKILKQEKWQLQIASVVCGSIEKNMGIADAMRITRKDGNFQVVCMKTISENGDVQFWKGDFSKIFSFGIPIDLTKALSGLLGELDKSNFSAYKIVIQKTDNGLNITCTNGSEVVFTGPAETLIIDFIKENAAEIAQQIKTGKVEISETETPTLPDETEN